MRIAVFASVLAAFLAAPSLARADCGTATNPPPALAKAMEDCKKAEQAADTSSKTFTTGGRIITTTITTVTTTTDDTPKIVIKQQAPPPQPTVTCVRRYGYYTVPSYYGYETLVQGLRTICTPPLAYNGYLDYYLDY